MARPISSTFIIAVFALVAACSGDQAAATDGNGDSIAADDTRDTKGDPGNDGPSAKTATVSDSPAAVDAGKTGTLTTVPARFRGTFAPDRQACAEDYDYEPTFQNVDVTADRVQYFENGGPVRRVEVDGNSIAIDYLDTYGDQRTPQVIYLALEGDRAVRYRTSRTDPVRRFVRCD
ncbi:hypothetical protein QQS45_10100 [Alteriqipengyuania flavescens]|uniref:hypothetical protein n=1 Tax=Alteriqipengyuania flavescens TaxID=3053610 RepID=UPI0025B5F1E6|nr:hypothetical protein [Alteriqipengyuania flavescens]WJY17975.1 hypothetical protein QQW98_10095 [Alteriqipengyuania flavescens]WJY23916.1 hypothetical protein QQS45_10100 [Alteriqipengyuania flavescens]